jgi:hypothetical protein
VCDVVLVLSPQEQTAKAGEQQWPSTAAHKTFQTSDRVRNDADTHDGEPKTSRSLFFNGSKSSRAMATLASTSSCELSND